MHIKTLHSIIYKSDGLKSTYVVQTLILGSQEAKFLLKLGLQLVVAMRSQQWEKCKLGGRTCREQWFLNSSYCESFLNCKINLLGHSQNENPEWCRMEQKILEGTLLGNFYKMFIQSIYLETQGISSSPLKKCFLKHFKHT